MENFSSHDVMGLMQNVADDNGGGVNPDCISLAHMSVSQQYHLLIAVPVFSAAVKKQECGV